MKRILLLCCVVAGCETAPENSADADSLAAGSDSATMRIQVPQANCYQSINGGDTVYLKLEKFPAVVTGTIVYDFYEKDGNTGNIEGVMKGDTLLADYTFTSEGQQSVRQVAFLVGDTLVTEGYGEQAEEGGKMVFKDIGRLDFSQGLQLQAIPCPAE